MVLRKVKRLLPILAVITLTTYFVTFLLNEGRIGEGGEMDRRQALLDRERSKFLTFQHNESRKISGKEFLPKLLFGTNICDDGDIYILFVVHTAVEHREERQLIRNTWGKNYEFKGHRIRHVFVVGLVNLLDNRKRLKEEAKIHKDIIQGEFRDIYRNLPHKLVFWLQWLPVYCPRVKYVLKCDDDVLVIPEYTVDFLESIRTSYKGPLYAGNKNIWMKPLRGMGGKFSRWRVVREQWPHDSYPDYVSGFASILSMDSVRLLCYAIREKLVEGTFNTSWRRFPLEDVYLGALANVSGIIPIKSSAFYVRYSTDTSNPMFSPCRNWRTIAFYLHTKFRNKIQWDLSRQLVHLSPNCSFPNGQRFHIGI
jgi:hypothetical protein